MLGLIATIAIVLSLAAAAMVAQGAAVNAAQKEKFGREWKIIRHRGERRGML